MGRKAPPLPAGMARALAKLGADIGAARRRRRIPLVLLAERALISRGTLHKILQGSPNVTVGALAGVLFSLGLGERLGDLAAASDDEVGLALEEDRLPQRIRTSAP